MKLNYLNAAIAVSFGLVSSSAFAQPTTVTVTIENLSPTNGTFQTPHWVGFHDGSFDIYNAGEPASNLPELGSNALESLAEDGNNANMAAIFGALQPLGQEATIAGPDGPIGPGQVATATFVIDSSNPSQRFFSYGSMVLPSNDFFYANANPVAHPLFDESGNFVAQDFFITNHSVRDAGTEINDEVPTNTAFFGQQAPNTGIDEGGVILTLPGRPDIVRFAPASAGGILADERFSMSDFAVPGYPLTKISFSAEPFVDAPIVFDPFRAFANLDDDQTVPRVQSNATGRAGYTVSEKRVTYTHFFRNLQNIRMAHLHMGARGETGPVVVNLLPDDFNANNASQVRRFSRLLSGRITADDLVGPLAGQSIGALAQAIQSGEIYVNIHTEQNPSGEIRGQVGARASHR